MGLPPLEIKYDPKGREAINVFYKKSSATYGATQPSLVSPPLHGASRKDSRLLSITGNPRFNGLKTSLDRPRYMDGCYDWLDKL
jgi:hypothetical protein